MGDRRRGDRAALIQLDQRAVVGGAELRVALLELGQLDADQMFYMKSRGLPEKEAQQLLVRGFCEQVTALVTLPSLKQQLTNQTR